jgi:hypothetical protein
MAWYLAEHRDNFIFAFYLFLIQWSVFGKFDYFRSSSRNMKVVCLMFSRLTSTLA